MVFRQLTILVAGLLLISGDVLGMPFGGTSCSFFCTANFHPVCGELANGDFKQYPNQCELDRALCYGDATSDATDIKCGILRESNLFAPDVVFSGYDDGTSMGWSN